MKEEMKELFIECCNQIQIKEIDEDKVEITNFDEILSKEFIDGLLKIANGAENLEKEIQNETFKIEILNAIQDDEELKIKVDCYLKMVSAKLLEKLSAEQPELSVKDDNVSAEKEEGKSEQKVQGYLVDMNRIVDCLNSCIDTNNNVQNELAGLIELCGENQKTLREELKYCLNQNMIKDTLITGMTMHLEKLNANNVEQLNKLKATRIFEEQKTLKERADIDAVKQNMVNITFTNGYELTENMKFTTSSEINIKECGSNGSYDDLIKRSQSLRMALAGFAKTKTMGELQ